MLIAGYEVTYIEVPDEINLSLWISECPRRCKNCHSAFLRESTGEELTVDYLASLIKTKGEYCTNILFLGIGSEDEKSIEDFVTLARWIRENTNKKITIYTGGDTIDQRAMDWVDYLKTGPYIEELGPLTSKTTNQKLLYRHENGMFEDITFKFWED